MGLWLLGQAEPRLLLCTPPQPSCCWKEIPSYKPKCLQCNGMCQPMAVSRKGVHCQPQLEGFDPSFFPLAGLNQQPPA